MKNILIFPQKNMRDLLQEKYKLSPRKLIAIHGGKLSQNKKTLELVKCVSRREDMYLLVFGKFISEEYERTVRDNSADNILFLGELEQKEIYDYYLSSDYAIFPGGSKLS